MNEDEDRANRVLRIIALIIAIGIILVTFVVGGFYSIYLLAEGGIYSVSLFVLALLVLEIIVTVKLKKETTACKWDPIHIFGWCEYYFPKCKS